VRVLHRWWVEPRVVGFGIAFGHFYVFDVACRHVGDAEEIPSGSASTSMLPAAAWITEECSTPRESKCCAQAVE